MFIWKVWRKLYFHTNRAITPNKTRQEKERESVRERERERESLEPNTFESCCQAQFQLASQVTS